MGDIRHINESKSNPELIEYLELLLDLAKKGEMCSCILVNQTEEGYISSAIMGLCDSELTQALADVQFNIMLSRNQVLMDDGLE